MKIPRSNLGRTCCVQKLFLTLRTIFVHNLFYPVLQKRRASDKDLPVLSRTVHESLIIKILFSQIYTSLQCFSQGFLNNRYAQNRPRFLNFFLTLDSQTLTLFPGKACNESYEEQLPDFDSWALTAGILLSKVLFFSNKRTRL